MSGGKKIIRGLEEAVAHSRNKDEREIAELFKELLEKLSGNTSFYEAKISKKSYALQAVIPLTGGGRLTIFAEKK